MLLLCFLYRIETASNRFNILQTKNLDVNTEGLIVDMMYFDNGTFTVLIALPARLFVVQSCTAMLTCIVPRRAGMNEPTRATSTARNGAR
jgi:hypothetical protein